MGTLQEEIIDIAVDFGGEKVFAKPNIPSNKIHNIRELFSKSNILIRSDDILVVIDETVFGGAKEGIYITNDYFACKEMFEKLFFVPLNSIVGITIIKSKVIVSFKRKAFNRTAIGKKQIKLSLSNEKDIGDMIDYLDDLFQDENIINEDDDIPSSRNGGKDIDERDIDERDIDERDIDEQDGNLFIARAGDGLFNNIKTTRVVNNTVGFAFDLITPKTDSEKVRDTFVRCLLYQVIRFREKCIDSRGIHALKNDFATLEIIIYCLCLIIHEMDKRGIPRDLQMSIVQNGVEEFLDNIQLSSKYASYILDSCGAYDLDEIWIAFLCRLYISNKNNRVISRNDMESFFMEEQFLSEENSIISKACSLLGTSLPEKSILKNIKYDVDQIEQNLPRYLR